jgi:hypothetical protein
MNRFHEFGSLPSNPNYFPVVGSVLRKENAELFELADRYIADVVLNNFDTVPRHEHEYYGRPNWMVRFFFATKTDAALFKLFYG